MRLRVYPGVYAYTRVDACTSLYACVRLYTHVYACLRMCTRVRVYACIRVYMNTKNKTDGHTDGQNESKQTNEAVTCARVRMS